MRVERGVWKMNRIFFAAALLLVLAVSLQASAASVKVISPVEKTLSAEQAASEESVLDLGLVGPGQKLEIVVSTKAGEVSKGGQTDSRKEAEWDLLEVVQSSLPRGWQGQNSLRFETPMKAIIVVAKDAPDGEYSFVFRTKDDFEGVSPVSIKAKAAVRKDVVNLRITGEPVKLESGQKGIYAIELENKASASDVFQLDVAGLPKAFEQGEVGGKTILVPFNSKITVPVEVQAPETGEYKLSFSAVSLSSPAITSSKTTTLFAGTTLASDLKAAARGVLLFPTAASPIYSLLALAAGIFLG